MGDGIKTNVNIRQFDKAAADRVPLGVITKENNATITRMGMDGKMQTIEANAGDKLYKGDIIKTPSDGSVLIALPDKSQLSGGPNNTIDISKFQMAPELEHSEMKRGTLDVINGSRSTSMEGRTPVIMPSGGGGVRG